MLGLPQRDAAEIRSKVVLSISTDKANKGRSAEMNDAFAEISGFLGEAVAMRRRKPADDLITKLAEAKIDGDALTEREIVLTTAMFVVAGVESLSSFMSIFAMNLAQMADVQDALRKDPALMKPAIEESLRYNTSAQRFKRVRPGMWSFMASICAKATLLCWHMVRQTGMNASFRMPTNMIFIAI